MTPQKNDKKCTLMFISSLAIVGTIGILRRYIPISSALLAFFRGLIGAISLLLLVAVLRGGHMKKLEARKFLTLALGGAFLGINWILLFEAYRFTTIAKATLCYYLEPTVVLLLSPILFKEKLTAKKLIAAAVSLLGMVFVSGIISSDASGAGDVKGVLFGIGAALFYSLVVILNKKVGDVDAYEKTIIQLFSAAIVLIPYLLLTEDFESLVIKPKTFILIFVAGIIYTGVVYALYFGSMKGLRAQTISALSYIDPVVALLVSTLILREKLSVWGIVGAVLILGSAFVSEAFDKSDSKS